MNIEIPDGNLVPAFCMEAVVIRESAKEGSDRIWLSEKKLKAVSASVKSNLNYNANNLLREGAGLPSFSSP